MGKRRGCSICHRQHYYTCEPL